MEGGAEAQRWFRDAERAGGRTCSPVGTHVFLDPSTMPDRVFANSLFYLWILSFGFLLCDLNL